jgi:hypothetical protein
MKKVHFVSLYSDKGDKKVIKIMIDNYFYIRKFIKLPQDATTQYISQLFLNRISTKFSHLKE